MKQINCFKNEQILLWSLVFVEYCTTILNASEETIGDNISESGVVICL